MKRSARTRYAIKIPYAASLILTHSVDGEVKGLNEYEGEHPPVAMVFWSFRVMLGMGVLMLLVSWWTAFQLHARPASRASVMLLVLSAMTFSGWVATLAGWYVTEIGRQPWIIYGLVRSADVVADHASATLTGTLLGYLGLYVFLLVSYIQALRYLASKPAQSLSLLPDYRAQSRPQGKSQLMAEFLPVFFVMAMGLALLLYVILDGFDLGVGLLLPLATDAEKDIMIASIGPFWDANETWIVLGIGILLIAFPKAHGIILTALYIPVTIMLFGLILRGVAFDFRVKAGDARKQLWNRAFFFGSLIASMAQGWMLGAYITGLQSNLTSLGSPR